MYEELKDAGFVVITVAMDARGAESAGPFIVQSKSTYPSLIDTEHSVSDLYNMVNVPSAVWIDEDGCIVRPTETAGTGDEWRGMMKEGISPEQAATMRDRRNAYQDAIRDWVENGADSVYALSPDEVRARLRVPSDDDALATANFRLGRFLWEDGRTDEAYGFLEEAKRLRPESWNFRRQTWNLQAPGDERSGGPEFWAAVEALGDHWYYEPVQLP
jgi:hypothetical protein